MLKSCFSLRSWKILQSFLWLSDLIDFVLKLNNVDLSPCLFRIFVSRKKSQFSCRCFVIFIYREIRYCHLYLDLTCLFHRFTKHHRFYGNETHKTKVWNRRYKNRLFIVKQVQKSYVCTGWSMKLRGLNQGNTSPPMLFLYYRYSALQRMHFIV